MNCSKLFSHKNKSFQGCLEEKKISEMLVCEDGTRNRVGRAHEGFVYCVLDLGYPFYTLGCVHTTHMNIHCSGAYLLKSIP